MASYSSLFSQVLDDNCIFIEPEDTTGIRFQDIEYTPNDNFPNWHLEPFDLFGKRKYGTAIGNKMEIILDSASFKNYYTTDAGTPYHNLNGIDTKSMREFAKEKYRKDVLEEFLKDSVACTGSSNYYVFSFITRKDCNQKRKCKIKMGPYACCSNDTNNINANLPEGFEVVNENGDNFLVVTRDVPCNERSCCEERYHYVCNENAPEPSTTWVLQYKDYATYTSTECAPNVYNDPNCPFYNPSTCKSGCGD